MAAAKTKTVAVGIIVALLLVGGGAAVVMKSRGANEAAVVATTTSAPASSDVATFTDGTGVELIAITDDPKSPERWWGIDGKPIAPLENGAYNDRLYPATNAEGLINYRFIFRVSGEAVSQKGIMVGIMTRSQGQNFMYLKPGETEALVSSCIALLPGNLPRVNLGVNIAGGQWTGQREYPVAEIGKPTTAPANAIALRELAATQDWFTSRATFTFKKSYPPGFPMQQEQFFAITTDGKQLVTRQHQQAATGLVTLSFDVPLDQVKSLLHRWRPFERRELRNVVIKPPAP